MSWRRDMSPRGDVDQLEPSSTLDGAAKKLSYAREGAPPPRAARQYRSYARETRVDRLYERSLALRSRAAHTVMRV